MMNRWTGILVAGLVVVLLVLLVALGGRGAECDRAMSGFWAGEPNFLDEAGLSQFYLFLGDPDGRRRPGYLYIADADAAPVSNQAIELELPRAPSRWLAAARSGPGRPLRVGTVRIAYDDDTAVMPEKLSMVLDPAVGTMTLYDDEKVYAFLTRDNETSLSANALFREDE